MILDVNVLLGRWPFAPIQYDTVEGVLELAVTTNRTAPTMSR